MKNGRRVLVADDEPGICAAAKFVLETLGYDVVVVNNGKDAAAAVEREPFFAVLLDVHMPVLAGPDAVVLMKAARPAQHILLMSGSSADADADVARGLRAGARKVLHKPFTIAELMEALA